MNKKIKILSILSLLIISEQNFLLSKNSREYSHKTNKHNSKDLKKKSKDSRESRINNFCDPFDEDNNVKLENAFTKPSKLTIWLRQIGLGILYKYHSFKNWLKNKFGK